MQTRPANRLAGIRGRIRFYTVRTGSPSKPIRLLVALHYLKYTYDLSDEDVVGQLLENAAVLLRIQVLRTPDAVAPNDFSSM